MASTLLTILVLLVRMVQPALVEILLAPLVGQTVTAVMEVSVLAVILDMDSFRSIIAVKLARMVPMAQVEMLHAHHVELTVMLAALIIHVLVASLTMGLILSPLLVLFALAPTQALEVIPHVLHA